MGNNREIALAAALIALLSAVNGCYLFANVGGPNRTQQVRERVNDCRLAFLAMSASVESAPCALPERRAAARAFVLGTSQLCTEGRIVHHTDPSGTGKSDLDFLDSHPVKFNDFELFALASPRAGTTFMSGFGRLPGNTFTEPPQFNLFEFSGSAARPRTVLFVGGRTWIAESENHRLLRSKTRVGDERYQAPVDAAWTWFGNGLPGAGNRQLNQPMGLIHTDAGLLVSEAGNHRIRALDQDTGSFTDFAGTGTAGLVNGNRATAQFNSPADLRLDHDGDIYVADAGNHVIRRIQGDGTVSTYAGSGVSGISDGTAGAAQFMEPVGLAIDPAGNLYVADKSAHQIRKIDTGGVVTSIAGDGTAGFADGVGAAARFRAPTGLMVDDDGSLLVADSENAAIRIIAPDGTVSTLSMERTDYGSDCRFTLIQPVSLTRTNQNRIAVVDTGRSEVLVLQREGNRLAPRN